MHEKLKDILHSRVSKNIASLGLVQVANYLIPLVLIPIVVRILGVEMFGRISYAQNIISYLTLLINFGFEYSATRQIALAHGNKEAERRIFWSVIHVKNILLLVSFLALAVLTCTLDRAAEDPMLYLYTALTNIGIVLFPTWYLQGIQDMPRMAGTNFAIKLLGALLIIALIHRAEQYALYPLLLSVASIAGGLWALIYVIRKHGMHYQHVGQADLKEVIMPSLPIFINNVFVSLYTVANLTILGSYADDVEIGYFSGAQRLIIAVNMCVVMPVSTALFPKMSQMFDEDYKSGLQLLKKVLLGAGAASMLVSVITYAAAPLIVRIMLGAEFGASAAILQQMAPLPFLIMTATLLTVQGLYGTGMQKIAPYVGLTLATICISANLLLIPRVGVQGAVWSWLIAQVAEIVIVGSIVWYKSNKKQLSEHP